MSTEHAGFMMTEGDELTLRKILKEELENLPCATMKSRVDIIETKLENGEKYKEIGITRFRLVLQTVAIVIGSPAMMLAVLKILKVI